VRQQLVTFTGHANRIYKRCRTEKRVYSKGGRRTYLNLKREHHLRSPSARRFRAFPFDRRERFSSLKMSLRRAVQFPFNTPESAGRVRSENRPSRAPIRSTLSSYTRRGKKCFVKRNDGILVIYSFRDVSFDPFSVARY